jgi:methionine-S-sulfoxide reductase
MGCFWEPSEELLKVDGVVDTVAGYTGNPSATEAPTYDTVCFGNKWVEGVRVKFDDEKVSYEQLLENVFEAQKPKLGSRQYASIIFPHDEEQAKAAAKWIEKNTNRERQDGFMPQWTEIEPLTRFFQAEGYHQRYWQKQRPRFALIFCLLAVATGALDSVVPEVYQHTVETVANGSVLLIAAVQILERVLDAKVVEL